MTFSPLAGQNRLGLAIHCLASLREGERSVASREPLARPPLQVPLAATAASFTFLPREGGGTIQ
jgi:hypothetical protein